MKQTQQGGLASLLLTLLAICFIGWMAWNSLNSGSKTAHSTPADVANKPKQVGKEVEAIVADGQKKMEESLKASEAGKTEGAKTD